MKLDMHFHTKLSDGRKDSIQIMREAKEKGLDFIACTDHDIVHLNFDSNAIALYGIDSCEAVEISAYDKDFDKHLHLTCYTNMFSSRVNDVLDNTRKGRMQKIDKQIELLIQNGFKIDKQGFYDFYKEKIGYNSDNLNISHIAWYVFQFEENIKLIKKLTGIDMTREDFLLKCLKTEGEFGYIGSVVIPEYEPSLELTGELARENDAVLSIAHPNFKLTQEEFASKIKFYLDLGVNAIEINSQATKDRVDLILEYQKKYNYIITFGSDCHFKPYSEEEHSQFGFSNQFVSDEIVENNFLRFKEKLSTQKPNDRYLRKGYTGERVERLLQRIEYVAGNKNN